LHIACALPDPTISKGGIKSMQQQPQKICPDCGRPAELNASFCSQCGHRFQTQFARPDVTQVFTPPPEQPTVPPYEYRTPPGAATYVEEKSKIAAALFAFFLGGLGVHGFYLGNAGMGATLLAINLVSIPLMLVGIGFLGWFAIWIITLIQAILYISATDYDFHRKYVVEKRWF
jgi:TM2 domain-containing membrane protein YozV